MNKVNVFLIIAAALITASAYPLDDNDVSDKASPLKGGAGSVGEAQQKQTETDSSESTEPAYIEETYIEVLLPFVPRLNTTEIEAVLNRTANDTSDTDDSYRLRRSADSNEQSKDSSSLEDVSPPSKGSTVPAILYNSRNITSESARGGEKDNSSSNESSEEKDNTGSENVHGSSSSEELSEDKKKVVGSSSAAPPLYQLRNVNTRPARDVGTRNSSSFSEDSEKEKSYSNEDYSEQKAKPFGKINGTSVLYTSSSSSSRQIREAIDRAVKTQDSSDTRIQQSVGNKDNEGPTNKDTSSVNKDPSNSKTHQQSQSTVAPNRPLYSAHNYYSRPGRETSGKDNVYLRSEPSKDNSRTGLSSRNTKNPVLSSESNSQGQKSDLSSIEKSKSPGSGNVAPAQYSTGYSNVRKVREVIESSEDQSPCNRESTKGPVHCVTPQNRALDKAKYVPKEASVSASPESLKSSSVSR